MTRPYRSLRASRRSAHGADLAGRPATAIERVRSVALEPADVGACRHREALEHGAALRIDATQLALVALPGAVPELSVHPGDPGDEAVRVERAQHRARAGIDLMDLPLAILPYPQRAFRPRQPRIVTAAREYQDIFLEVGKVTVGNLELKR